MRFINPFLQFIGSADYMEELLEHPTQQRSQYLDELHMLFYRAGWEFKKEVPKLTQEQRRDLRLLGIHNAHQLTAVDLVRLSLLEKMISVTSYHDHYALIQGLIRKGTPEEQSIVLRGIILLPEPQRFIDIVVDACRSAVKTIFEAVASHNIYPERFFPTHRFNNLVLKAIHLGVSVKSIVGVETRINAELVQMVADYRRELEFARRPVPADVDHLLSWS